MISKTRLKYYSSLLHKKFRFIENKFITEGIKIIEEGIRSNFHCEMVFLTQSFINEQKHFLLLLNRKNIPFEIINEVDLLRLCDTEHPQGIVAVFHIPKYEFTIKKIINDNLLVYLENISDPGNLGTIIRTCDWFGIKNIFLSKQCTEVFNPKVIRSSAGSIFHINVFAEIDFNILLPAAKENNFKIYCADLNGLNIFNLKEVEKSIIIFANEANGPSPEIINYVDDKITIPKLGKAESLNVSTAAAVIISGMKQNQLRNREN